MLQETRLAGYRVLRSLGAGERAEVLLGAGEDRPVALKRFLPTVPPARVLSEIDAIERIDAPHLPRVLDLAGSADGPPVLVLERWSPLTLGALLARRRTISAGEAVTLLAPVAETIERMHAAGYAHGGIGAGAVHLAVDGAPVLGSLGALERFAAAGVSDALRESSEAVAEDARALLALATTVSDHLDGSGGALRLAIERLVAHGGAPHRRPYELLEALFAAAPASPVRFPGDGRRAAPSSAPARIDPRAPLERDDEQAPARAAGPIGWLAAAQLPEWLERLVDAQGSSIQRSGPVQRIRAAVAGVRPRFRVLGAVTLLGVLAMGGLLAQRGAQDGAAASDASVLSSTTDESATAPVAPAPAPSGGPADGDSAEDALLGDDPVAAARTLLERRDDCLARAEQACLDGVLQAGSALLREDRARIDATQLDGAPAERLGAPEELAVVQELGAAVLLSARFPLAEPETAAASLLVVRSEAGWRLRDLL